MKSNINIEKILEKVPDYQQFYDTDELNEQSFRLALNIRSWWKSKKSVIPRWENRSIV